MALEKYVETFREMDGCGILSEEDRRYLVGRGILEPKNVKTNLSCPSCGSPLPKELIQRIASLLIESISRDRNRLAASISQSKPVPSEHDSMMFR
ncbi:hypothetical protein BMS3Abin16_01013 [archaeon BMS3Abin16]|nr:hypothetical protein BMS3Abin16_01013 [archaeon BMS3Abin16]HDY73955.1 hypothetical protein [Euryarchaeota archaeon]